MNHMDFRTLSEAPFGTTWYVEGGDRVVVNAYSAALYFSTQDFLQFAEMIHEAHRQVESGRMTGPTARGEVKNAQGADPNKVTSFRPSSRRDD